MQILGHFCLLVIVYSVLDSCYKKILAKFHLGFSVMDSYSLFKVFSLGGDFGCGVFVIGCFRKLMNVLGLLMFFCFGLKVLRFLAYFVNGFCLRSGFDGDFDSKISFCSCGLVNFLKNSSPPMIEKSKVVKETVNNVKLDGGLDEKCEVDKQEQEHFDEDDVFDVMTLRRLVKMERRRAYDACLELEKERMAATTAAEEAMAMILRLQNEKSVIEMEAYQQRRLAHEKQLHDQQVIQSLRWIVMKHESERSLFEDRLRLCKQRSKHILNCDGEDGGEGVDGSLSYLDALDEGLISSLDLGLSP